MSTLQAWLVPHAPEEAAGIGCGLGPVPAVHSGFAASWQKGLKASVSQILKQAVKQSSQPASRMRMLITGQPCPPSSSMPQAAVSSAASLCTDACLLYVTESLQLPALARRLLTPGSWHSCALFLCEGNMKPDALLV